MEYPTLEQVEAADAEQLAKWFRFLPTPGVNAVNATQPIDKVNAAIQHEGAIMDRIIRRLAEADREVATTEIVKTFFSGDYDAGSNS